MAGKSPTPSADPPVSRQVEAAANSVLQIIDIARIQPYERNPRHGRNPEYDRVKDSIRSAGLDQPLVVTQRPGAADYIVHAGGNTRLKILKELFEETGDPRHARVPCLFRPWRRESDVLLAHLRENDLRGNLTFIDKARGVLEIGKLMAEERVVDEMSQRQLEDGLRDAGYRISQSLISQMEYAACRLLPVIPLALEHGLGRPQVERIRKLERSAYSMWRNRCAESRDDFEAIFVTLCRRYDGPDWDTDVLRSALESEIAGVLDISIHTVRMMFDAELAGRELMIPAFEEAPGEGSLELHGGTQCVSAEAITQDDVCSAASGAGPTPVDELPRELSDRPEADDVLDLDSGQDADGIGEIPVPVAELLNVANDSDTRDLKSLRGRAWTLAARLAQRNGMSELIEPVSGKGLGTRIRQGVGFCVARRSGPNPGGSTRRR